jgi:hypothetical protein
MRDFCRLIWWALVGLFRSRVALETENLVLRQQTNVLRRTWPKRPAFSRTEASLTIVKPDTLVRWHHAGFKAYWRWKSRSRNGRPTVPLEIRFLIRDKSLANPLWGDLVGWLNELGGPRARTRCAT